MIALEGSCRRRRIEQDFRMWTVDFLTSILSLSSLKFIILEFSIRRKMEGWFQFSCRPSFPCWQKCIQPSWIGAPPLLSLRWSSFILYPRISPKEICTNESMDLFSKSNVQKNFNVFYAL
ncbi:hypothetical protein VNO77_16506 [Canavalia gladiata]|uniref:Uncharacterized protein n=1 Tax=Canavalia gladiata TaxID=3824 RepID=A0AAN9QT49_CANGL